MSCQICSWCGRSIVQAAPHYCPMSHPDAGQAQMRGVPAEYVASMGLPSLVGAQQYRALRDAEIEIAARRLLEAWDSFDSRAGDWDASMSRAIRALRELISK
jgi:hypothetical protein